MKAAAVQAPGPVAENHHIGGVEQPLERFAVGIQVDERRALAEIRIEVLPANVGHVRWVDPKHVSSEQRQCAGGDRPGDDPAQIQHPLPGCGQEGTGRRWAQVARWCRRQDIDLDERQPVRRACAGMFPPLR